MQPILPGLGDLPPAGLRYEPAFLSSTEEHELLAGLVRLEWGDFRMHGVTARRKVVYFGHDYAPDRGEITRTEAAPPGWIVGLRARCAQRVGTAPESLAQVLAAMYPPGAAVGWHRDAPPFGIVIGLSLGTGCRMRFRALEGTATYEAWLEPGSAYVIAGAARWALAAQRSAGEDAPLFRHLPDGAGARRGVTRSRKLCVAERPQGDCRAVNHG